MFHLEEFLLLTYQMFVCHAVNVCLLCVHCRIPDSIGKDIEKACQGIYPLHDVYVRKVKVLKKPKFDGMFRFSTLRDGNLWAYVGNPAF